MGLYQCIGIICLGVATSLFLILGITFKSVWIKPKSILLEKADKKYDVNKMKVEDTSKKETKYNNFWKKIWEK